MLLFCERYMTTGQVLEAGQRADADGWEWERSSAA